MSTQRARSEVGSDWDESDLVVQSSDMALMNIEALALSGALDLSPEFQRRNRWGRVRQSQLIESFLLNVPVPPVYLAEELQGRYSVIDGKQRLTAIANFLDNQFPLTELKFRPALNGLLFRELEDELRATLIMRPIRSVTIMRQTPPWKKYEVFLRLNTGGEPLNHQEVRNVAFAGPLNSKIIEASEHDFLRRQLKIRSQSSPAYSDMTDVEFVVRFLAMRSTWERFSGNYRTTLDSYMLANRSLDPNEAYIEIKRFNRAIDWCQSLWGEHAFKRFDGKQWRDQLIGGVYDAQMLACDQLDNKVLGRADKSGRALELMEHLFKQTDFEAAVRAATNTPSRVRLRVAAVTSMLNAV